MGKLRVDQKGTAMSTAKKKVALLSNIMADLISARLRRQYEVLLPEGYDTWVQEVLNPQSTLFGENPDAAVVLLDGTEARSWKDAEEAADRIGQWKNALTALLGRMNAAPVFVSTVDVRGNRIRALAEPDWRTEAQAGWHRFVFEQAEKAGNLYVFDLADTIAEMGRRQFYSNKMWYMSSMPYSRDGMAAVCREIGRALGAAFSPRRKVIALDLDNTLWGGVIGEDGVEGIELSDHKEGQRFYDFQRQLLEMKKRGIVLAVNSKNNPEDAEAAIQGHPAMLLRDGDFACRRINWQDKAENLKAMEQELNISEGGFVFIDDNPVERETVRGACPEALVPEFPADTAELLPFAEELWMDECLPLRVLGEDLERTQMYRNEALRRQEMTESLNLDDYLTRLEMTADIHRMRPEELERVAQLCGKTNQFNVTTRRRTAAEISALAEGPDSSVWTVHAADKYGDSGLISVLILRREGEDIAIDTFLMSCRVMGRRLEEVILNELAAHYVGKGRLLGEFIPTAKNVPVRDLYDRLGFEKTAEDGGHKHYALSLADYRKKDIACYREIRFQP